MMKAERSCVIKTVRTYSVNLDEKFCDYINRAARYYGAIGLQDITIKDIELILANRAPAWTQQVYCFIGNSLDSTFFNTIDDFVNDCFDEVIFSEPYRSSEMDVEFLSCHDMVVKEA